MILSTPNTYYFQDDGGIPNSNYPLIIYKKAFTETGTPAADYLEKKFAENGWTNAWRWGIYPFHHYHSNTHEVLAVFNGEALLQMGGKNGEKIKVKSGDILILPTGLGHRCLSNSEDFIVIGAYPSGKSPDLMKGEKGERPEADRRIEKVKAPEKDPWTGKKEGLLSLWI